MSRKAIYNACQWYSSSREVLSKCTFGIHCWMFYLLYAALCPPVHVGQMQWFWVLALWCCWCLSFCSSAGTEACTGTAFGCCVPMLDSVGAHAVFSLSSHTTCCFFSVRQRKVRWLSLHSCEPVQLRDTWAVYGLPGITTYVTHCAGLVRKKNCLKHLHEPLKWS